MGNLVSGLFFVMVKFWMYLTDLVCVSITGLFEALLMHASPDLAGFTKDLLVDVL